MSELRGSRTEAHLREAFARESQTALRYLYFAQQADIEGRPDLAALFRVIAEGETGHALAILDLLADAGDPLTNEPIGETDDNLQSAVVGERNDAELYSEFAETARTEGFTEIADWMATVVRVEQQQLTRFVEAARHTGDAEPGSTSS